MSQQFGNEQTPSERAESTRLNHEIMIAAASAGLPLTGCLQPWLSWQKPLIQSGLAEGREGRMGRGLQESKSADPLWETFLHQPGSSRQDWVSFQDHRNCLPCQSYLHSQLEPTAACSAPVTDTEVTHNWKMPDKRKKKQRKRLTQQFKTLFGTLPVFFLLYA